MKSERRISFYILLIPFLLLSLYGGCGGSGGSNELICSPEEMQDRFAETDCIAEELVTGCTNIGCIGDDVSVGSFDENCIVVDCETLECERITIRQTNPQIAVEGFLTELIIDETNGLPSGIVVADEMEFPFDCFFISNN
jgi:hypothetical protein